MNNKEKFEKYKNLLLEYSKFINLVSKNTLSDIDNRHFEDSAQLSYYIPKKYTIVDLGSGAGFPGIILNILGYKVICIESIKKKTFFLQKVIEDLNLTNITIINDRIENCINDFNKDNIVFTARAFAPLYKILDYTFSTKKQLFLLKGKNIKQEIEYALLKYKFSYNLYSSKTGDGYISHIIV